MRAPPTTAAAAWEIRFRRVVFVSRANGWHAMHAVSLGHGDHPCSGLEPRVRLPSSPRLAFTLYVIMAKSISVKRKSAPPAGRPGRPATGTEPLYGVRIGDCLIAQIMRWAKVNGDLSRSEAIRRLVEIALAGSSNQPRGPSTSKKSAARAAELAAKTIDKHLDPKSPAEEREARKRKLVEGPSVFRDARKDRPGKGSK